MIDLDVRLDSSLVELDYGYLSRLQGLKKHEPVVLNGSDVDFEDYVLARENALELLQTEEAIKYAFMSLFARLERAGYVYIEVGFNPYYHTKSGLKLDEVTNIAVNAFIHCLNTYTNLDGNLILYSSLSAPLEIASQTASLAYKYRNRCVIAYGLEGDTEAVPIARYARIFARMRKEKVPVVIEMTNKQHTVTDLNRLLKYGVRRIISLYKLDLSPKDIQTLASYNVAFEWRPTHDRILGYVKNIQEMQIKYLWSQGFLGFVAGCSYSICKTSLLDEYRLIIKELGLQRGEVQIMISKSLDALFVSPHQKNRIVHHYVKSFDKFYKKLV